MNNFSDISAWLQVELVKSHLERNYNGQGIHWA